jgi:hypothetical protein
MWNPDKKKKKGGWITVAVLVWFVMNIRVSIGIASTFERVVDGLVGIALLGAAVFLALEFFGVLEKKQ